MHFSITLAVIASLAATTLSVPHATRNPDVNDLVTRTLPQDSTYHSLERRTSSVQGEGADSNAILLMIDLETVKPNFSAEDGVEVQWVMEVAGFECTLIGGADPCICDGGKKNGLMSHLSIALRWHGKVESKVHLRLHEA
ncbi:hypothetical protein DFH28DRAFT_921961 [Melampsora americana]|nr:hypothetical protein DFH28DRAFT_921961 [Melampsora americana]